MDRLSIEILSLIAAAAASSGPQIDLSTVYDVWTLHDKPKFPGSGKPKENSLSSCAAVSRDWQLAFEPFTFQTLVLSPKRIVQTERQGYLTPRRLGYIRNLAVPITFPLPWPWDVPIVFAQVGEWPPPSEIDDGEDHKIVEGDESATNDAAWEDVAGSEENDEDLDNDGYMDVEDDMQPPEERGYDKLFTAIIRSLFRILKLAPVHENGQPYMNLQLGFPVPREYGWCFAKSIDEPEAERLEVGWCNPLYLDLGFNQDELPNLLVIASCSFDLVSWSLFFDPESVCKLASKMPRLRKIKMHLSDMEWRNPDLRVGLRGRFASSLPLLPQGVLDFELQYSRRVPRDHSHAPASIVPPDEKHDLLSQALFHFSQRENLLRFSAKGSFDLNILGTSEKALTASNGWPKLETYDIGFLAITPSGQWLAMAFTDNPNTDSFRDERWGPPSEPQRSCLSLFDTNEFRGPIEPDYAHRLVCTAGRTASHMPRLRRMNINVGVVGGYKVCYTSKKVNPCMRIVGKKLQPPIEELLRVWRRVAQDRDQQFGLEWNDTVKTNKRKMLFS